MSRISSFCYDRWEGVGSSTWLPRGGSTAQWDAGDLLADLIFFSDSPLNAEAAELWDKDPEEFKRKVTARHRDIDDE